MDHDGESYYAKLIQKEGQLDEETRRKRLRESILTKMGGSSGGTKTFGAGEFDTGF